MLINITSDKFTYKRVMINVLTLGSIRLAVFASATEYFIAGNGNQMYTDYNSLTETQYADVQY